jgi:hypothetical protein
MTTPPVTNAPTVERLERLRKYHKERAIYWESMSDNMRLPTATEESRDHWAIYELIDDAFSRQSRPEAGEQAQSLALRLATLERDLKAGGHEEDSQLLRAATALLSQQPAQPQAGEWRAEAEKTLDHLARFLQRIGAPHAVDWRTWIDNAEKHIATLTPPQGMSEEEREALRRCAQFTRANSDMCRPPSGSQPELAAQMDADASILERLASRPAASEDGQTSEVTK